ncbi:nuclear transport factor 2 family protein [Streptomyces sp. NPDC002004]
MTSTTPTASTPPLPATPPTGGALFERWTELWNGDLTAPEAFLAPDFSIWFGNGSTDPAVTDAIHGPAAIVDFITAHRAKLPGVRYFVDGTPLTDPTSGQVASRWYVTFPDPDDGGRTVEKSGIDFFAVDAEGRIARVWSLTGIRRATP